jgi:hypothetical protein
VKRLAASPSAFLRRRDRPVRRRCVAYGPVALWPRHADDRAARRPAGGGGRSLIGRYGTDATEKTPTATSASVGKSPKGSAIVGLKASAQIPSIPSALAGRPSRGRFRETAGAIYDNVPCRAVYCRVLALEVGPIFIGCQQSRCMKFVTFYCLYAARHSQPRRANTLAAAPTTHKWG